MRSISLPADRARSYVLAKKFGRVVRLDGLLYHVLSCVEKGGRMYVTLDTIG